MSTAVREALGPEATQRVLGMSLAGSQCPLCDAPLPMDGPATVLMLRGPHSARAAFAHPSCSPSGLRMVDDEPVTDDDGGTTMYLTAFVVQQGAAGVPVLVAELAGLALHVPEPGRPGEVVNIAVSLLLERGLFLVSRLRNPLRRAPGWSVTVTGDGGGALVDIAVPGGDVFYSGTADLPDGWSDAARELGWCLLYSGAVQLPEAGPGPAGAGLAALRDAAAAGGLVGGRVVVEHVHAG